MGFFDFLFKRKKQSEPEQKPKITLSVEFKVEEGPVERVRKSFDEFTPADIDGYVSPSGGFVNYTIFKLVGVKAATGKKNTRRYIVQTEQDAKDAAVAEGLVEPFTITVEPMREPSEAQRNYARNLGITIPDGACLEDVSAMISRVEYDDTETPDAEFAKYVHSLKVRFSRFIGTKELIRSLPDLSDDAWKIVRFTYSLYMLEKRKAFQDNKACEFYKALAEFGAKSAEDRTIIKSLDGLCNYDIAEVHKRTKVYIVAAEFLKDWL